jgi:hypothetical protein
MAKSFYDIAENQFNSISGTGYAYEGNIFKNTMSHLMFNEEKRAGILAQMEKVVFELIENTKSIKLMFGITMNKNYRDFN